MNEYTDQVLDYLFIGNGTRGSIRLIASGYMHVNTSEKSKSSTYLLIGSFPFIKKGDPWAALQKHQFNQTTST